MDKQLQDYYESRFSMFAERGWRDLIEDVVKIQQAVNSISGIPDAKALHFKQGELSILNWLLNLEATSLETYNEMKGENANSDGL